jgi:hypothetical protein
MSFASPKTSKCASKAAVLASPGNLLEIQDPRPHPRATGSEWAF